MVEIPDGLRCLFSAEIEQRGDSFEIAVPKEEILDGEVSPGEMYRIAVLSAGDRSRQRSDPREQREPRADRHPPQRPPVSEGETRTVAIETTGDQGDGIARVERGYVVIVPGSVPGDELDVEITTVKRNFAMAEIVDEDDLTYE